MTRVVVVYATKMGATRGIAETIGDELRASGLSATVQDASDIDRLDGYDAAVVGSALYTGRWRPEAVTVLNRQANHGVKTPIWLYQSGPCDTITDRADVKAPKKVLKLAATLDAVGPVTFGGRLSLGTATGFLARRMAAGPMGGDYREFDLVRAWARRIAAVLLAADLSDTPAEVLEVGRAPGASPTQ